MTLSAVITAAQEGGFIVLNPETGTTSQGESIAEAMHNLREATELFLEEFPEMNLTRSVMTTFEVAQRA